MSCTKSVWKMKKRTILGVIPLSPQSDVAGCHADCNRYWLTWRDRHVTAPEFDQLQVR